MQMLPRHSKRAPLLAGTFCLVLAGVLTGCASKNPLIDEPAPVAAAAKPIVKPTAQPLTTDDAKAVADAAAPEAAATATTTAAAAEAKPAVTAAAPAAATSGVQVKREKRFLGIFSPYRPDIQQGNFVSQEMVAQLKEGMTQDQVIFLLGTPLLTDVFHADRWDYAFRMQKGNGEITSSRVTVHFKDKLVSSFEGGGDLPTEKDYLARIADKAKAANK